jgi:hypothetical protein
VERTTPPTWTTAVVGLSMVPSTPDSPTSPSRPTMAISADAPLAIVETSEMTAVTGK